MHTAVLKQWNDAVIVELPNDFIEQLHAVPGQCVTLRADASGLALGVSLQPRFTLREMLDPCNFAIPVTVEEEEWTHSPAVGRESI